MKREARLSPAAAFGSLLLPLCGAWLLACGGSDSLAGPEDGSDAGTDPDPQATPTTDAESEVNPGTTDASAGDGDGEARFSFFYTSLAAMQRLSGSQNGFGGDLRFGTSSGLEGADKICQSIAEAVGAGDRVWRAFLSAVSGPDGQPVHAIDRIGEGPWYDRTGRLVAQDKAGLLSGDRPAGEAATVSDLPDESGLGTKRMGDTHDVITGSNRLGQLRSPGDLASTCQDWTSTTTTTTTGGPGGMGKGGRGGVMVGHAWPAGSGRHWVEAHTEASCAAGVNLVQNGPGDRSSIGAGGGWGGFYCFALTP